MRTREAILSFTALLAGIAFLAASNGITLITHICDSCGSFSVTTGVFTAPAEPDDDCCEMQTHCSDDKVPEAKGIECCHYSIEKLKVTNFAASGRITSPPLWDSAPMTTTAYHINYSGRKETINSQVRNKHGSRNIISLNCQILS